MWGRGRLLKTGDRKETENVNRGRWIKTRNKEDEVKVNKERQLNRSHE